MTREEKVKQAMDILSVVITSDSGGGDNLIDNVAVAISYLKDGLNGRELTA